MLKVNNEIYNHYGDKWYLADNDPVALLRVSGEFHNQWISSRHQEQVLKILDLGCGGGFLTNHLSKDGHEVTGVDLSDDALNTAKKYDETKRVTYTKADATELPFADATFDVVCAMDLLEHVEDYDKMLKEVSRVLRPGGTFYFHTFNRNFISYIVIIKLVEWLVPNTPKHMHVLNYFIKPIELIRAMKRFKLCTKECRGTRPEIFNWSLWKSVFVRRVLPGIKFLWTKSLVTAYAGYAVKHYKSPV